MLTSRQDRNDQIIKRIIIGAAMKKAGWKDSRRLYLQTYKALTTSTKLFFKAHFNRQREDQTAAAHITHGVGPLESISRIRNLEQRRAYTELLVLALGTSEDVSPESTPVNSNPWC